VQPIEIVRQVQQMFMVECQKVHDIQTAFHIADSYQALNVDIVMLDSSRLLQVVSNQGTLGSFGVSFELCTLLLAVLLLTLFIFFSSLTCTQMPLNSRRPRQNEQLKFRLEHIPNHPHQSLQASITSQQRARDQTLLPEVIGVKGSSCIFVSRYLFCI
jgi:hypothetical protein